MIVPAETVRERWMCQCMQVEAICWGIASRILEGWKGECWGEDVRQKVGWLRSTRPAIVIDAQSVSENVQEVTDVLSEGIEGAKGERMDERGLSSEEK